MISAAAAARIASALVLLLLVWRVIEVNVLWYGYNGRPKRPALPAAQDFSPADRKAGELSILRRMVIENPGDTASLLVLADELARSGRSAQAGRAYRAALDLAPLDRWVLMNSAAHFLREADPAGVGILSRLAGNYPDSRGKVFPILAQVMVTADYRHAWNEIVARDPEWMGSFLTDACRRGVDPAVLLPTILARSASGYAVSSEASCAIDALRRLDRWDEAYHLWLSLLPRGRWDNVGYVFNGSFEAPLAGAFDWRLQEASAREAGHVADIVVAKGAAGRLALRVIYAGNRQAGSPARQYLALLPGNYEVGGLGRPDGIAAVRGIRWTLRCVREGREGDVVAASERFIGSSEWRAFAFDLQVGADCPGQVLQLEPAVEGGGVAFISGTAWFDDLRITQK